MVGFAVFAPVEAVMDDRLAAAVEVFDIGAAPAVVAGVVVSKVVDGNGMDAAAHRGPRLGRRPLLSGGRLIVARHAASSLMSGRSARMESWIMYSLAVWAWPTARALRFCSSVGLLAAIFFVLLESVQVLADNGNRLCSAQSLAS